MVIMILSTFYGFISYRFYYFGGDGSFKQYSRMHDAKDSQGASWYWAHLYQMPLGEAIRPNQHLSDLRQWDPTDRSNPYCINKARQDSTPPPLNCPEMVCYFPVLTATFDVVET
jgi:hypothetical protein